VSDTDDDPYDDDGNEENDEPFEYQASYDGPCTCFDNCPAKDEPGAHGWGSCNDPGEVGCECEAGWTE
jgi:hypothetical protein